MSTGLIEIMKRAALEAFANEQMCDLRYGTVVSTNPLRVQITNQLTVPSSLLVVPKSLTNHTVSVTVDWNTESTGEQNNSNEETTDADSGSSDEATVESHAHAISGTKTITINNALNVGDKVALLRKQGGQSYFILDRI